MNSYALAVVCGGGTIQPRLGLFITDRQGDNV